MALKIGYNSFVTLEEAQSIVEEELYSDSLEYILWSRLNESDREKICKQGALDINTLEFIGRRDVSKYKLKFPRIIHGEEVIPEEIKIASVLNGLMTKVTKDGDHYKLIRDGVESMTVGPNSVKMNIKKYEVIRGSYIYDEVRTLVDRFIATSI